MSAVESHIAKAGKEVLSKLRSLGSYQPRLLSGCNLLFRHIKPRRAAVALVLRLHPQSRYSGRPSPSLEGLFIKRAANERDRWSGHVGLPGGGRARGETLFDAAVRETREETGINLDNTAAFEYLGRLDDRNASFLRRRRFIVSTFVFLQRSDDEGNPISCGRAPLSLQESEVAGVRWAPLNEIEAWQNDIIIYPWFFPKRGILRFLVHTLRFHRIRFPAFTFPLPSFSVEDEEKEASELDFRLWGLTLGIVSDFGQITGLFNRLNYPPMCFDKTLPPVTWTQRVLERLLGYSPTSTTLEGYPRVVLATVMGAVGTALALPVAAAVAYVSLSSLS
mmetsp:Transcript_30921/g.81209  ORF Transcript_30921/g.81209 Transcript_30921/m.81209 type:complete len:335 (-) Transcript_30921:591-1595(-)